jgi:RNA recognition motif-containing protein
MHGSKLYVGNLHYTTTSEDIETLFSEYGSIESVKLIEGKGFGFVEMATQAEAENAKEKLDGFDFKNRQLKVNEAKPPAPRRGRNFRR